MIALAEHDVTVHQGDVREQLAALPDGSVQCVVTSPPYFGLRAYGDDDRELGREQSPTEYVAHLMDVCAEIWRILRPDGVFWLNIGDTRYSGRGNPGPNAADAKQPARRGFSRVVDQPGMNWGRPKSLLLIPDRLSIALFDQGWTVRDRIIWSKANPMPESPDDRCTSAHEYLFQLTKSRHYWFDVSALDVPATGRASGNSVESLLAYGAATGTANGQRRFGGNPGSTLLEPRETRRERNVWTLPSQPFPGAHFAVFPPELPRRCIVASCPPGGTVLDPWSGSGTTLMVARSLGRKSIGIELYPENIEIIRQRIGQTPLDFGEATA